MNSFGPNVNLRIPFDQFWSFQTNHSSLSLVLQIAYKDSEFQPHDRLKCFKLSPISHISTKIFIKLTSTKHLFSISNSCDFTQTPEFPVINSIRTLKQASQIQSNRYLLLLVFVSFSINHVLHHILLLCYDRVLFSYICFSIHTRLTLCIRHYTIIMIMIITNHLVEQLLNYAHPGIPGTFTT